MTAEMGCSGAIAPLPSFVVCSPTICKDDNFLDSTNRPQSEHVNLSSARGVGVRRPRQWSLRVTDA
jgi:hypothetical protein